LHCWLSAAVTLESGQVWKEAAIRDDDWVPLNTGNALFQI